MADLFAETTEWLAARGVTGVDWNALAAKRQDSVRSTQYMDQYLLPAFERASRVIDTLALLRAPPDDVLKAYSVLTSSVYSVGDKALEAAKLSAQITAKMVLPAEGAAFGIKTSVAIYNLYMYHLWSSALVAAEAHTSGRIHMSGIPDADIAYHASICTMCLNLISWMDRVGALVPLKKTSTNGLGAVPLAAIIVIGSVIAIAIVWGLVAIYQMSLRQKIVEQVCNKAVESGDPVEMKRCDDLINNPEANLASQIPKLGADLLEKAAIAAMLGAGVYVLFLFGPGIATKMKQTIGAWRSS